MVITDQPMTALEVEMAVEQHGGPLKCEYMITEDDPCCWQPVITHGHYRILLIRIRNGKYHMIGVRKKSERLP